MDSDLTYITAPDPGEMSFATLGRYVDKCEHNGVEAVLPFGAIAVRDDREVEGVYTSDALGDRAPRRKVLVQHHGKTVVEHQADVVVRFVVYTPPIDDPEVTRIVNNTTPAWFTLYFEDMDWKVRLEVDGLVRTELLYFQGKPKTWKSSKVKAKVRGRGDLSSHSPNTTSLDELRHGLRAVPTDVLVDQADKATSKMSSLRRQHMHQERVVEIYAQENERRNAIFRALLEAGDDMSNVRRYGMTGAELDEYMRLHHPAALVAIEAQSEPT